MLEKDPRAPRQHPYLTRHAPRRSSGGSEPSDRAWQAQVRLFHRYRHLINQGKRPTVVNVAIARELAAFIWAEMTGQPPREQQQPTGEDQLAA